MTRAQMRNLTFVCRVAECLDPGYTLVDLHRKLDLVTGGQCSDEFLDSVIADWLIVVTGGRLPQDGTQ